MHAVSAATRSTAPVDNGRACGFVLLCGSSVCPYERRKCTFGNTSWSIVGASGMPNHAASLLRAEHGIVAASSDHHGQIREAGARSGRGPPLSGEALMRQVQADMTSSELTADDRLEVAFPPQLLVWLQVRYTVASRFSAVEIGGGWVLTVACCGQDISWRRVDVEVRLHNPLMKKFVHDFPLGKRQTRANAAMSREWLHVLVNLLHADHTEWLKEHGP